MKRDVDHEGRAESAVPLWDAACRLERPTEFPTEYLCVPTGPTLAECIAHGDAELPRERAELRRDLGMSRAAHAAERAAPGWEEQAISDLRTFARGREHFSVEDFREAFPPPADVNPKALGGVVKRAQRLGIVKADGFVLVKCSNLSPRTNWKSLVFEASA